MIRPAGPEDAPAISRVHVASWHETYPGLVPGWEIAARTHEDRLALWSGVLAKPTPETAVFVAERDGAVVGFGMSGPQRTETLRDLGHSGEIWSLYVLRAAHGQGTGRALMDAMLDALAGGGPSLGRTLGGHGEPRRAVLRTPRRDARDGGDRCAGRRGRDRLRLRPRRHRGMTHQPSQSFSAKVCARKSMKARTLGWVNRPGG